MFQIRYFGDGKEVEEAVNEWLSTVDVEIVDIKFQYDWNTEIAFIFVAYKS